MPNIQKSMRLPEHMVNEIYEMGRQSGRDFSTVIKELLESAIKMERCPGIVFSEGVQGRRARIAGTGIEVWEVVAAYQGLDADFERLAVAYHWLSETQLRAAIGYYRLYPEEIDELLRRNESWTAETTTKRYPFMAGDRP